MAKKLVPIKNGKRHFVVTRKTAKSAAVVVDSHLSVERDCICETMAPHCPVHSPYVSKRLPAPGSDVIR